MACFALGCSERSDQGTPYTTFHSFPRDRERAVQWLKALGREDTEYSRTKNLKVCSRHFDPKSFRPIHRWGNRVVRLVHGTLPTLNLGLDGDGKSTLLDKKDRKKTRRKPFHFREYSEEQIIKSPRKALRAFRSVKLTIKHNSKLIRELSVSQASLQERLMKIKTHIDKIPSSMKSELGLNFNVSTNLAPDFNKQEKALLSKPEGNPETNKTGTDVKIKEEPLSESEEEPKQSDSELDEEPILPDSDSSDLMDEELILPESDSSDLMDEDDWAETFREDPGDEAPDGIPIKAEHEVESTSIQMPIIKSVSSLSERPPLHQFQANPMLQNGPDPNGTSSDNPMTASLLEEPCRCTAVGNQNVTYGEPIVRISKSTQTAIIDLVDSKDESGPTYTNDDLEEQTFERFGTFVAKRLSALGPQMGRFLQNEFGTLMYKVERGIIRCPSNQCK